MQFVEESYLVQPRISLLNRFAQKAKQVAITSVNPVFSHAEAEDARQRLMALRIQVEGPSRSLARFRHLLEGANLNVK